MRVYSQDLRNRVLGALERGESPAAIARHYQVSRVWVYQVKRRSQGDSLCESLRIEGDAMLEREVRGWIMQKPDLSLAELCEQLEKEKAFA